MSAPAPRTVNVPELAEADPATPTLPMSCDCQGEGSDGGGGGGGGVTPPAVVNERTAPGASLSAIVLFTIRQ